MASSHQYTWQSSAPLYTLIIIKVGYQASLKIDTYLPTVVDAILAPFYWCWEDQAFSQTWWILRCRLMALRLVRKHQIWTWCRLLDNDGCGMELLGLVDYRMAQEFLYIATVLWWDLTARYHVSHDSCTCHSDSSRYTDIKFAGLACKLINCSRIIKVIAQLKQSRDIILTRVISSYLNISNIRILTHAIC